MILGEFGGKVLRPFSGDGVTYLAGHLIPPERALSWPVENRAALGRIDYVEWFKAPRLDLFPQAAADPTAPAAPTAADGSVDTAPADTPQQHAISHDQPARAAGRKRQR